MYLRQRIKSNTTFWKIVSGKDQIHVKFIFQICCAVLVVDVRGLQEEFQFEFHPISQTSVKHSVVDTHVKNLSENLMERDYFGDPDVDGRIILKVTL
jgi:hypothetical protein